MKQNIYINIYISFHETAYMHSMKQSIYITWNRIYTLMYTFHFMKQHICIPWNRIYTLHETEYIHDMKRNRPARVQADLTKNMHTTHVFGAYEQRFWVHTKAFFSARKRHLSCIKETPLVHTRDFLVCTRVHIRDILVHLECIHKK
jgi:hypothetical protein